MNEIEKHDDCVAGGSDGSDGGDVDSVEDNTSHWCGCEDMRVRVLLRQNKSQFNVGLCDICHSFSINAFTELHRQRCASQLRAIFDIVYSRE